MDTASSISHASTTTLASTSSQASISSASIAESGDKYLNGSYGVVQDVPSGDTLVIVGKAAGPGKAPPVIRLTLASLTAPRLSHGAGDKDEEPYAFASREYLRRLCIGKSVQFKVEYSVQTISRSFGWVRVMEPIQSSATTRLTPSQLSQLPISQRFKFSENVCVSVAREGWGRVRESARENEKSIDYEEMTRLNKRAEGDKRGVFGPIEKGTRKITWQPADPEAFLQTHKGKPLKAIIEYIRDGSTMKALILSEMTMVSFYLTGISSPRLAPPTTTATSSSSTPTTSGETTTTAASKPTTAAAAAAAGKTDKPATASAPFSHEAKHFTEVRLLQRDIEIVLEGLDKSGGYFFASIKHSAGNITTELLKNGLAKLVDWSIGYLPPAEATALRNAQKEAKEARVGIWRDQVPTTSNTATNGSSAAEQTNFKGVIAEVVSGDTVIVRVPPNQQSLNETQFLNFLYETPWLCEERRLSLSSIRAPKVGNRLRSDPDEPYAQEAKEYLRNQITGKLCNVNIDYIRDSAPPGTAGGATSESSGNTGIISTANKLPPRKFATITVSNGEKEENISLALVQLGFAEVQKHRADDDRSPQYDQLLELEATAKKAKKARWSEKTPPQSRIIELAGNATKAKTHLPHLQRGAATHRAFVDYVHNGARMKILIPSENCTLNFALAGIICPAVASQSTLSAAPSSAEPFGREALAFTRALVHQQEVEVRIETMDRGGTAIGIMTLKRKVPVKGFSTDVTVAELLLERGLAKVADFSARQSQSYQSLIQAEKIAINKRLRIWENYDAELKAEEEAQKKLMLQASPEGPLETIKASVTEVINGSSLYLRFHNEENDRNWDGIQQSLNKVKDTYGAAPSSTSALSEPRSGVNCLGLFDDGSGNTWYRCRIINVVDKVAGRVRVRYSDFGNEEILSLDRLRKAEDSPDPNLFKIAPLAVECNLAFITAPTLEKEYGNEAAIFLNKMVWGQDSLQVLIHNKTETGKLNVSIYTSTTDDINSLIQSEVSVNEELIKIGFALLEAKYSPNAKVAPELREEEETLVNRLIDAEEFAHKHHNNMWRYGDPRESADDDENTSKFNTKSKGAGRR